MASLRNSVLNSLKNEQQINNTLENLSKIQENLVKTKFNSK